MSFGNFHAVTHDVNDFGDVPYQIMIIRSETVAQTVLNPNPKFQTDLLPWKNTQVLLNMITPLRKKVAERKLAIK